MTGANGYVGRHVVASLVSRGQNVVVATRSKMSRDDGVEIFDGDVLIPNLNIFEETGRPDILIHLAWEDGFVHASPKHLDNLPAHVIFLKNMLAGGLRHVVGAGTSHEIGFHVGPITEHTPTFPQNAYGIAKNHLRLVQELLCREHCAVSQWVRCFYIVGDDINNNSIFKKLLLAEAEGRAEFPLNSGELLYDFVDVAELGEMIADVAGQDQIAGTINCCSGEPVTLKTMVLRFIEKNNLKIKPIWGAFPMRTYDSRAIWGDATKIRAIQAVKG
ncbi:NAD-dependent epimerase/dehydratase family protein [Phyllobacterium sp. 22229]|uniref:NAD-dependent epimerase/dehydratase family protein n=1 Tax=Phyllobacterium sp. 22229 TaxID=3453895 RepID=UPI003F833B1B